ncbi:hypothetical protein B0H12DRAFT_821297 [Mycena haematopus]|nr:hypothetical protein B0H12DRAFT_821297 [Mycena haematopus]
MNSPSDGLKTKSCSSCTFWMSGCLYTTLAGSGSHSYYLNIGQSCWLCTSTCKNAATCQAIMEEATTRMNPTQSPQMKPAGNLRHLRPHHRYVRFGRSVLYVH